MKVISFKSGKAVYDKKNKTLVFYNNGRLTSGISGSLAGKAFRRLKKQQKKNKIAIQ